MKLITRIATCALAVFVTAGSAAAQHFPDETGLLSIIETRVDEGRATGIVLGVLEADGTTKVVAYGEAGPDARPLDRRSVFEIGSISKAFTGILLADMVQRGELALEGPLQAYVHDGVEVPSRDGREITLLDVATHRSSLPRLPDNMEMRDPTNPYADYTVDQLHAFLDDYALTRDIGSEYEYSNLAVGLLGHVLAARAGTDYETLLHDRILEPLEMEMSGIDLSDEMRDWLAQGHDYLGNVTANWDLPTLAGAGAIRSNADDMLKFLAANIGEPETELERAMRASHQVRREAGGNMHVGLLWHMMKLEDGDIVWHNGGTGGYRTFVGFDPVRRVGAVVLTNSTEGADDIGFHLINPSVPLTPAPPPEEERPERVEIELSRSTLERYVGVYELTPQFQITVTLEDDGLHVQATDQPKFRIYAEAMNRFFLTVVDAQITFIRESGETTSLILHQGGADQTARKVG
ncbi:MAG: serine hydrolase [Gemmatimonadetes bacterium]|nr:serine hydrolase [Gemmatimonadota bacterium]